MNSTNIHSINMQRNIWLYISIFLYLTTIASSLHQVSRSRRNQLSIDELCLKAFKSGILSDSNESLIKICDEWIDSFDSTSIEGKFTLPEHIISK